MGIEKIAENYYKLCLAREDRFVSLLLKINNSPRHYLATSDMTSEEKVDANYLEINGLVFFIPEGHTMVTNHEGKEHQLSKLPEHKKLPERYVITATGNHYINTFINTLSTDIDNYKYQEYKKQFF